MLSMRNVARIGLCALVLAGCTAGLQAGDPPPPKLPKPILPLGPFVRYDTPRAATIYWQTAEKCPSVVVVNGRGFDTRRIEDASPKTSHELTVTGLTPREAYTYQVIQRVGGKESPCRTLKMDLQFNYAPKAVGATAPVNKYAKAAEDILKASGIDRGYCLVYGFGSGGLALELARRTQLTIVGVDENASAVAKARASLRKAGVYGSRITVHHVQDLGTCPQTRFFANLIVSETLLDSGKPVGTAAEMYRMLRPEGGVACLPSAADAWLKAGKLEGKTAGKWTRVRRGPIPGAGQWTHQYGTPANRAFGGETLSGASATRQMEIQWLGRPGADFGLDRNPRMPAPLSVGGRLFHQGMRKIIALDAYNGTVLWTLGIPDLLRLNIPRDASNWCVDGRSIYVAVRDRCWVLNAATGKLTATMALPPGAKPTRGAWSYVASVGGVLLGSCVNADAPFENFWTTSSWYDAFTGGATAKVCSDTLFAADKTTGKSLWTYGKGAIINTTLAADENRVYFVECRNTQIVSGKARRISDAGLWKDLFRVALDIKTGKVVWEQAMAADMQPGDTVFYLAVANGRVFVVSSKGAQSGKNVSGAYRIYTFDAATGKAGWSAGHNWVKGDHGAHMQHPVITDKAIYIEPCGYAVADGKQIANRVGPRQGCATFAGTTAALLHRGPGRMSSMWNMANQSDTQWTSLRPSCWLSMIPAGGMILSPEGGGGCSCGGWIETSVGMLPVATRPEGGK